MEKTEQNQITADEAGALWTAPKTPSKSAFADLPVENIADDFEVDLDIEELERRLAPYRTRLDPSVLDTSLR